MRELNRSFNGNNWKKTGSISPRGFRTRPVFYDRGVSGKQSATRYPRQQPKKPLLLLVMDSNGRNIVRPEIVNPSFNVSFELAAISIPGGKTFHACTELRHLPRCHHKVSHVVLAFGTNDMSEGMSVLHQFPTRVENLISVAEAIYPKAEISYASIIPRHDEFESVVPKANDIIRDITNDLGMKYIKIKVPSEPEYWSDLIHMSDDGLRKFMRSFESQVEAKLFNNEDFKPQETLTHRRNSSFFGRHDYYDEKYERKRQSPDNNSKLHGGKRLSLATTSSRDFNNTWPRLTRTISPIRKKSRKRSESESSSDSSSYSDSSSSSDERNHRSRKSTSSRRYSDKSYTYDHGREKRDMGSRQRHSRDRDDGSRPSESGRHETKSRINKIVDGEGRTVKLTTSKYRALGTKTTKRRPGSHDQPKFPGVFMGPSDRIFSTTTSSDSDSESDSSLRYKSKRSLGTSNITIVGDACDSPLFRHKSIKSEKIGSISHRSTNVDKKSENPIRAVSKQLGISRTVVLDSPAKKRSSLANPDSDTEYTPIKSRKVMAPAKSPWTEIRQSSNTSLNVSSDFNNSNISDTREIVCTTSCGHNVKKVSIKRDSTDSKHRVKKVATKTDELDSPSSRLSKKKTSDRKAMSLNPKSSTSIQKLKRVSDSSTERRHRVKSTGTPTNFVKNTLVSHLKKSAHN